MDLENFISLSLVQIAKGIEKANSELSDSTARVNPLEVKDIRSDNTYGSLELKDSTWVPVQKIDFDVAVTASEGSETKGGLGISDNTYGVIHPAESSPQGVWILKKN